MLEKRDRKKKKTGIDLVIRVFNIIFLVALVIVVIGSILLLTPLNTFIEPWLKDLQNSNTFKPGFVSWEQLHIANAFSLDYQFRGLSDVLTSVIHVLILSIGALIGFYLMFFPLQVMHRNTLKGRTETWRRVLCWVAFGLVVLSFIWIGSTIWSTELCHLGFYDALYQGYQNYLGLFSTGSPLSFLAFVAITTNYHFWGALWLLILIYIIALICCLVSTLGKVKKTVSDKEVEDEKSVIEENTTVAESIPSQPVPATATATAATAVEEALPENTSRVVATLRELAILNSLEPIFNTPLEILPGISDMDVNQTVDELEPTAEEEKPTVVTFEGKLAQAVEPHKDTVDVLPGLEEWDAYPWEETKAEEAAPAEEAKALEEEKQVEEAAVEETIEEKPTEEAQAEGANEEAVSEENAPAEEVKPEETPVDEVVAEEAPTEEATEETPAEEAQAEPVEETNVEETPAEEAAVDETTTEAVVEEASAGEEPIVSEEAKAASLFEDLTASLAPEEIVVPIEELSQTTEEKNDEEGVPAEEVKPEESPVDEAVTEETTEEATQEETPAEKATADEVAEETTQEETPAEEVAADEEASETSNEEAKPTKKSTTGTVKPFELKKVDLSKRDDRKPTGPVGIRPVAPSNSNELTEEMAFEESNLAPLSGPLHSTERSQHDKIEAVDAKHVAFSRRKFIIKTYDGELTPEEAFTKGVTKVQPPVSPVFANQANEPAWKAKRRKEEIAKNGYNDVSSVEINGQKIVQDNSQSTKLVSIRQMAKERKTTMTAAPVVPDEQKKVTKPLAPVNVKPAAPVEEEVKEEPVVNEPKPVVAPLHPVQKDKPRPTIKPIDVSKK